MLCDFPAAQLLIYRRNLAHRADTMVDGPELRDAMASCLAIDHLRILHEGITGCQCWYEAIAEAAKKPLAELLTV